MFVCLVITSCSDNLTNDKQQQDGLTASQLEMRDKLKASTLFLQKVVTQPKALKELRYAINFYTEKKQLDERVYFSSMFRPTAAYKKAFAQSDIKGETFIGSFADAFRSVASDQTQKNKTDGYTVEELKEFLNKENIALYFPYKVNWEGEEVIPTLTYHPLDNEHVNEGWKPIIEKENRSADYQMQQTGDWEEVTVNDEYGQNNPTMILAPCMAGEHTDSCDSGFEGGGGGGGTGNPEPSCQPGNDCAYKVQVAEARLKWHLDGFFAGGSKVRWLTIDAVKLLPSDEDPDLEEARLTTYFSRSEVNNWKTFSTQFDNNWEEYELTKPLKMYEADGGDPVEVDLSIDVNILGAAVALDLGFSIGRENDPIIKTYYQRDVFFSVQENDISDEGMKNGLPVRDAGAMRWTMSITEIPLD